MKVILPALLVLVSCNAEEVNESQTVQEQQPLEDTITKVGVQREIDTVLLGDLNFDEINDTAIVFEPLLSAVNALHGTYDECDDDSCVTRVEFSFDDAVLYHTGALGFHKFFATADLDSDGIREVAFIPDWFQSCWSALFVYSLRDGKWTKLAATNIYACSEETFEQRVRKINSTKFEIIGQEWNEDFTEVIDVPEEIEIE